MSALWREWQPGILVSLAFSFAPSPPSPPCLKAYSYTGFCGVCCPDWSGLWQLCGGFAVISSHSWLTNKQSPKAMWLQTHKNGLNSSRCVEKPMTWICWCGCWLMTSDPRVCLQRRQNSNIIKIYSNFTKGKYTVQVVYVRNSFCIFCSVHRNIPLSFMIKISGLNTKC